VLISPPTSSGDDEDRGLSFEQVHKKYEAKIYNLIFRLVGNHDDAEELAVETFLNAWKAWDRFRGEARVSTWLHQIALNNCKNRFKQNDRRKGREVMSLDERVETDAGDAIGREVADWRYVPERALLEGEFSRQLHKAIEALAPEYREVLVLAEMEDMSYEQIAEMLNLTIPAVKTRLHRARQKIKQRLEPYYRGWGAGGGLPSASNTGADPSVKRDGANSGGGAAVRRSRGSDAAAGSSS
jgi:RNA polymerase sigma-70 factor (ECF subfamily)